MGHWVLVTAIVTTALGCPAMMWLGRRGIGPGCAVCPPRQDDDESLDALKARQRSLAAGIERLEAHQPAPAATARD